MRAPLCSIPRAGQRRGVTLLEVLVVVVILGALIAISIPNMKGFSQRTALRGAASEILSGCNVARQAAIATQREVYVLFDIEHDRWRIHMNVAEDEEREMRYSRDAIYDLEMVHELPPNVYFTEVTSESEPVEQENRGDPLPVVVYYPDGSASPATVGLKNQRDRIMTVEVSGATGRVSIYNGPAPALEDKLIALGADPAQFGLVPPQPEGKESSADQQWSSAAEERRAREQQAKEQYYQDIVSRIAGQRAKQSPRIPR